MKNFCHFLFRNQVFWFLHNFFGTGKEYHKNQNNSAQFSQSDLYYASIPLEYQSIYEGVEAMLEQRKDTLEAMEKRRNDSVRKANLKRTDSIKKIQEAKGKKAIPSP